MTRVTEDDLEWLVGYCDGDSAKAARIVREMRAELLALRKIAEAAAEARSQIAMAAANGRPMPGNVKWLAAIDQALRETWR